jgi:hypothetical protein
VFIGQDDGEIMDVRGTGQKERLYKQKAQVWTKFGYEKSYLDRMKKMDFWESEYKKIPEIDKAIRALRDE